MAKKKKSKKSKAGDGVECCFLGDLFDVGCYVATAAHGDVDAPEVVTLRAYRDERLLTNAPGRLLTRLYYGNCSGPAALLRRYPALRAPARAALRPVVAHARRSLSR